MDQPQRIVKTKPPMTLGEMSARAAGRGKAVCPRCHCADCKIDKTKQQESSTVRYANCRHCGCGFVFRAKTEILSVRVIREGTLLDDDDDDECTAFKFAV